MKKCKKWISLLTVGALLSYAGPSYADDCCYYTDAEGCCYYVGGCGYEECRRAPSLAPAVALGTIVAVAIVAVVLQNSSGSSAHTDDTDST